MVHAEQIEEQNLNKQVRLKRTRAKDGNSSKFIFEVKDKPRFKKRFPNQIPSTVPRVNKGKWCTHKPKEDKGSGPYVKKVNCVKCCRKY